MSLFKTPLPLALDLSDYALKILALEEDQKMNRTIRGAKTILLPKGFVQGGIILKKEELIALTKQHIKELTFGKNSPEAIMALPEEHTFLTILTIPKTEEKKRNRQQVLEEAERHIPITEKDMYWDMAETQEEEQILFGAVPKLIADSYAHFLEQCRLVPLALEIESLAIARTLPPQESQSMNIIIDIGATRTGLLFLKGNVVRLAIQIPFSGNALTSAIQETLQCDEAQAETIKKTKGWNDQAIDGALKDCATRFRGELHDAVSDAINFFRSQEKNEVTIQKMFLAGGGGLLPGLPEALHHDLSLQTERLPLPSGIKNSVPIDLSYATAFGLATGGALLTQTFS